MSFRLTQGEPVNKDLRRIVAGELESAIAQLRQEDDSCRDEAIHEARKSIKKLRAVARLLMPGLGPAGTRDQKALRDTGRALSRLRDAAALIETVEALSNQYFADPAMEPLAVVRSALRRRMEETVRGEDCRTVMGGAVASLKSLRKRTGKWQMAGDSFATIAPGLENTYRRGRKALKKARKNTTPEKLHDLRKRIKDYWYHVRLLEGPWQLAPNGLNGSREKELRELQEWLGEHQNLVLLRNELTADPSAFGGKRNVPAVLELIGRAEADLRKRSLEVAARVYEDKPGQHLERIGLAWEAWNGKAGHTPAPAPAPAAMEAAPTVVKRRGSAA